MWQLASFQRWIAIVVLGDVVLVTWDVLPPIENNCRAFSTNFILI
jgi:hypothetical protein